MAKPPLIYPDTCLFVNVIKEEAGFWPDSLKVLLAAERGDVHFCASTLVLGELVGWNGDVNAGKRNKVVDQYLTNLGPRWVEVDLYTVEAAADIAARYQLRGADAIHLTTAVRAQADYFLTWDGRFPIGAEVDGVKVRNPSIVWDPTVDDQLVEKEIADRLEREA